MISWMAASIKADFCALKWIVVDSCATERCTMHIDILLNKKEMRSTYSAKPHIWHIDAYTVYSVGKNINGERVRKRPGKQCTFC